jgi:diguanylate cyclase (GGDEF)-like protein/PAS domain S-box-containing protein
MALEWVWIAAGALVIITIGQQIWIYRVRREARRKEELFQILTENAADMIALVDVKGRRLYNSPAYKRILGYSAAELGETSSFEQIHPEDRYRVLEAARAAKETGVGKRLEYRIRHKDGSWRVFESSASTIRDGNGEVAKLVIVNRDITERKKVEQQLEHNLFHDALTGLPNRRMLLDRLQNAFADSRRESGRAYALLLVNIDHFKVFNETAGTTAGDHVLIEIAQRMANELRRDGNDSAKAMLFRLGGDEFAALLDPAGDPSDALRIATRLQTAVAKPFVVDSRETRASASIGIALSMQTHERPEDILKDADTALRRAKGLGGSRCEVFDEVMHSRATGRLRLESDLRTALAERQFEVRYQPVMRLDTRRVVSFEALLRWNHPTQGLISPYGFLDAAEDTGILVSLGHWLIVQACRQLREWEMSGASDRDREKMILAVNISARQFADARLAVEVQQALRETGVQPSQLRLEITESVAAADPKLTAAVLSHLRHLGVGVVLDNFGTGSASLTALRHFPVDMLKIDRPLVRDMMSDSAAADIVELIVMLAHKMKLEVIAEGVETVRQVEHLMKLGCECGQGYYFSQPLEAKAALEFMRKQMAARAGG